MSCSPRDVVRIVDRHLRGRPKRFICVCRPCKLFLRINSKPVWIPHHHIPEDGAGFLDWDSYVELSGLVRHNEREVRACVHLGRLNDEQARALCEAVRVVRTLPVDHKDLIIERLWNNGP